MEELSYRTADDRLIYPSETQRHHAVWRKAWYNSPIEKAFRGLVIVRLTIGAHRQLHSEIEPPIKPNLDLMHEICHQPLGRNEYDRFDNLVTYLGEVVMNHGNRNAEDAAHLLVNFKVQQYFIDKGRVDGIQ